MSKDDIIDYIQSHIEEGGVTIEKEDVAPPRCAWCGDVLTLTDPDISVWDVEHEGGVAATRYFYCSEAHEDEDRTAAVLDGDYHPEHDGYEVGLE